MIIEVPIFQYLPYNFFLHSEEKTRRPRAQTNIDVKALTQVLEAKGEFILSCYGPIGHYSAYHTHSKQINCNSLQVLVSQMNRRIKTVLHSSTVD